MKKIISLCLVLAMVIGLLPAAFAADNTVRPLVNITRAEAITLINRVLARVPKSEAHLMHGMKTWSDNTDTDAWYYLAIQEATNDHTYTYTEEDGETWTALS